MIARLLDLPVFGSRTRSDRLLRILDLMRGRAIFPFMRRGQGHSSPAVEGQQRLAKNHARSPKQISLQHEDMHVHTEKPTWTQLRSQTRNEKLSPGRFAYSSISRSPRIVWPRKYGTSTMHPRFPRRLMPTHVLLYSKRQQCAQWTWIRRIQATFSMCGET